MLLPALKSGGGSESAPSRVSRSSCTRNSPDAALGDYLKTCCIPGQLSHKFFIFTSGPANIRELPGKCIVLQRDIQCGAILPDGPTYKAPELVDILVKSQ